MIQYYNTTCNQGFSTVQAQFHLKCFSEINEKQRSILNKQYIDLPEIAVLGTLRGLNPCMPTGISLGERVDSGRGTHYGWSYKDSPT